MNEINILLEKEPLHGPSVLYHKRSYSSSSTALLAVLLPAPIHLIINPNYMTHVGTDSISSGISRDLYEELGMKAEAEKNPLIIQLTRSLLSLKPKLKESTIPLRTWLKCWLMYKSSENRLGLKLRTVMINGQTQKGCNLSPGFVDLEVNNEVKQYDSLIQLAKSDKA